MAGKFRYPGGPIRPRNVSLPQRLDQLMVAEASRLGCRVSEVVVAALMDRYLPDGAPHPVRSRTETTRAQSLARGLLPKPGNPARGQG